jgi:ATP-dependent helicase/nuclease subunit A
MSSLNWTPEQLTAIEVPPGDLLVSAAAGAGKTAVLVERVIRRLMADASPVDIDQLLIVTFTEAAAAEMRQRIGSAITHALGHQPDDERLQRQLALLNRADISTIHAFCLKIVRRYFYLLDLDPGFRIADETEAALILREAVDELWEDKYSHPGPDGQAFRQLLNCYSSARSDDDLKETVLKIYNFSRSQPWPDHWLRQLGSQFQLPATSSITDLPWTQAVLDHAATVLSAAKSALQEAIYYASRPGGPTKYLPRLEQEVQAVDDLIYGAYSGSWEQLRIALNYSFDRLSPIRKNDQVNPDLKDYCTAARDRAKGIIAGLQKDIFSRPAPELVAELVALAPAMTALTQLVLELGTRFEAAKQAQGRVDFADLEHYLLRILRAPESTPEQSLPSSAARQLQQEYQEVLVDEYQDINPVQDAILNLISRPDREGPNIFVVGDVKQSIYGFRSAEPGLFLHKYLHYPAEKGKSRRRISLTSNFRSRPGVLTGVNFLFRQLLTPEIGGLVYDQKAELYPGAIYASPPAGTGLADATVEVCLVERQDDSTLASDLSALEKEALIIGRRIQALVQGTAERPGPEFVIWDQRSKQYRPLAYRDIVILMRTVRGRANVVLETLQQLSVPAYADLGTGYFAVPEIQTMVSLLQVIDNPQQDIPLAAVLRSPLVGLSAAELAEVRLAAPAGDFYSAVDAAVETVSAPCRQKLARFLQQLETWRTTARRRSLGELIWQLYRDTGYLTYVAGLPAGAQRQANLRALYDRARQFESYGRPGLFRFLRFLDRFQEQGDLGTARALGENEDVVRVMSIHKSKGLEFPLVFIADLGKQINFEDLRGDILLHKKMGLGPTVVDLDLKVKYPSLAQRAVKLAGEKDILAEELRILYVALTRAREKLFLVGSADNLDRCCRNWNSVVRHQGWALPPGLLLSARTYLDWLGPALIRHDDAKELRSNESEPTAIEVKSDSSSWRLDLYHAGDLTSLLQELAAAQTEDLELLLPKEPPPQPLVAAVNQALQWQYPHRQATTIAAKASVSELKGRLSDAEAETGEGRQAFSPLLAERPRFISGQAQLTPLEHGSAVHLILEHLDLKRSLTTADIRQQVQELIEKEVVTAEQARALDSSSLASFFAGPLGQRLRDRPAAVRREIPFSLILPAEEAYPQQQLMAAVAAEPVLVQGIIDCAVREEKGWLLLDFKTDRVRGSALEARLEGYKNQLRLYARALECLSSVPVAEAYLYFLTTGLAVKVSPPVLSKAARNGDSTV